MYLLELEEHLKKYPVEFSTNFRFSSITGLVGDEVLLEVSHTPYHEVGWISKAVACWSGLITTNMDDGMPFEVTKFTPLWIHFPNQHAISFSVPILDSLLTQKLDLYYVPEGEQNIPDRPEDPLGF